MRAQQPQASLAFMDCDRTSELLRVQLRGYRDAYAEKMQELPDPAVMAGAMMVALREGVTNAGALTAMFVGLKALACEVLDEARH